MNSNSLFEVVGNSGLYYWVGFPKFGQQDLGITPSGAADLLAFKQAHLLLGEPQAFTSLEIIFSPRYIKFNNDAIFCLSGAHFSSAKLLHTKHQVEIHPTVIYQAYAGDLLQLSGDRIGLRSYLLATPLNDQSKARRGIMRGEFSNWFPEYSNCLDVIAAPEYDYLIDPKQFLEQKWQISPNSNAMGIRLLGQPPKLQASDIISSPVCNGTIQFTNNEPIILLSQRQTIGGYPRGFVLTPRAQNHLAQIGIKHWVKFNLISRDQAQSQLQEDLADLAKFRTHCKLD